MRIALRSRGKILVGFLLLFGCADSEQAGNNDSNEMDRQISELSEADIQSTCTSALAQGEVECEGGTITDRLDSERCEEMLSGCNKRWAV